MSNSHPLEENKESWLEIGKIVAPQGLKGELKVLPSTDFPERFEEPGKRWLQSPKGLSPEPVDLISGRYIPGKNLYVIRLKGIKNIDQAELLRGHKLLVPSSDRPQLKDDEYHVSELINLEVYHQLTGEFIGIVTDIFGAGNDLLEVQLNQEDASVQPSELTNTQQQSEDKPKQNKVLIPFVYEIVPVVDLDNKRIEINPPKGLLELAK
ncbi:ribosome maturation factor RimM [Crocosphaera sp. UHCC 0190]|uniref:ribosome maturation factor RimM n=1 Tax=Crocosphaera sp. UHCC 0190 TaxID=3110246 RepID=UPI002B211D79|nr:ribosome maturation factor RimM [Crocosphaera sp. UHCC 0190]MEA5510670.1 ribosome maturation factor RimM [Crocosphaera sp. UHCC 0190]